MTLSKQLDRSLLDLAWSLWTELGVAGVKRKHQNSLIQLEELILFTSVLAEVDPRLRDESLDWCSKYHRFISVHRLKSLMKDFPEEPFLEYAAMLNSIVQTNWPSSKTKVFLKLSGKSVLRPLESAALLNIRTRSIFGVSARADLLAFFLTHKNSEFSISDVANIGYAKRTLAELLEDLQLGGFFDQSIHGNQFRYRLANNEHLFKVLNPIPQHAPSWQLIFKVLLSLRECVARVEKSSETTQVIEIQNCLESLKDTLKKLRLKAPKPDSNFRIYLDSFSKWLIDFSEQVATGNFSA